MLLPQPRRPDPLHQQPAGRVRAKSAARRSTACKTLNEMNLPAVGDPETHTRIQQYEMAFRMQTSVPELTDLAERAGATFELYGDEAKKPGTFANTALLARRLVERGVRFVQIYHNNWDTHGNVAGRLPDQCQDVDQPCWGLIQDLKQRGLLDETLVIWGGEFGRTIYSQGGLTQAELRPRPPSALLHDVDGRRRHQGRARSTARPTTSRTTSSRIRSTSATSTPRSCTCSASITSGFTFRYPGPRPAADRCRAGPRGRGTAGVSSEMLRSASGRKRQLPAGDASRTVSHRKTHQSFIFPPSSSCLHRPLSPA